MPIDEELLRPTREYISHLNGLIAKAEQVMVERIERYAHDDAEYAYQISKEYHLSVEPLRRQRDAAVKIIADYYGLQRLPSAPTTLTN